jgi:hypothetical protein
MLRVESSAQQQTAAIIAGINLLLRTRTHGIHVAGPKQQIAASLAFRITETALRGTTRFPEQLDLEDIAVLTALLPFHSQSARKTTKDLLTAIIRNEINSGRMVAAEVTSPQRAVQRHVTEYWVMTPEQWQDLQRMRTALPRGTTYRRALTSR